RTRLRERDAVARRALARGPGGIAGGLRAVSDRIGGDAAHEYRTVSSREIFDGRVVRLRVDTVSMPGGGTADREICGHDDAVAVVAVDERDRVAMVRQYRHPVGQRLWELPAGLCDVDGEDPVDTGRRELVEEAGLEADRW